MLLEVCELMQKRHSENFRQIILSVPGWSTGSKASKFSIQVGNEEIYTKKGSSTEIRETCYEIVTKFDYPRESLVIKDSKGEEL